jgi:hypothetical protein
MNWLGSRVIKKFAFPSISLAVLAILLLQTVASFRILCPPESIRTLAPLRLLCAPSLWPFLDYPMYAEAHYAAERIHRPVILGLLAGSVEVRIVPEDLGLHYWLFQDFISALRHEDGEQLKKYVDLYESKYDLKLTGLRLENHPLALFREGLRPAPLQVIKIIDLDARQKQQ